MCLPKKIAANKHPQLFLQTGSNNAHHQPTFSSSQSDNNPGPNNIVSTMTNGTTGRKRPRSPSSTSSAATTTSSASSSASHQQQRRGRVRFANTPHEVVGTVEPCSSMSEHTKTTIWYPPSELDRFKDAARDAGRKMRTEELRRGPSSAHHHAEVEEEGDTNRGLEHRTSLERQRNKYVALRAVVECYRRLQTGAVTVDSRVCEPDVHLALVSSKVTRWAREVALSTGQSDFLEAYPMLRGVVPPPRTVEEIGRAHPFPLALKRRSSFGGGQAGRVSPLRASSPPLPVLPEVKVPSTAASSSSGSATPPIVSPVPSPVTLSPVSLPAHPTAVEEDEDSDDEARRRMTKRQRTGSMSGGHHAHHGLTLVVL